MNFNLEATLWYLFFMDCIGANLTAWFFSTSSSSSSSNSSSNSSSTSTVKLAEAFGVTDSSAVATFKTEASKFDSEFISTVTQEKETSAICEEGRNSLTLASVAKIEIKANFVIKSKAENPNAVFDYTTVTSDLDTLALYENVMGKDLNPSEFKDLSKEDLTTVASKTKEQLDADRASGKTPAQALAEAKAAADSKAAADKTAADAAAIVAEDAAAVASTDPEIQTAATAVQSRQSRTCRQSQAYVHTAETLLRAPVDVAEILLTNRSIDSESLLAPDTLQFPNFHQTGTITN